MEKAWAVFKIRKKAGTFFLIVFAFLFLNLPLLTNPPSAKALTLPAYRYTKVADVTNGSAQATDVEVDSNNNVYLVGYFSGTVIFDGIGGSDSQTAPAGSTDSYLTKFSSSGTYEWTKIFDTTSGNTNGLGITIDAQNNIYTTGSLSGTAIFDGIGGSDSQTAPGSSTSTYLTKYGSNGSYQWTKILDTTSGNSSVTSVEVDSSGSVYISGAFTGSVTFDGIGGSATYSAGPSGDGFVSKYASNGSYAWTKTFDASSGSAQNTAIAVDNQNNVYVSGTFSDTIIFDGPGGTDSHTSGSPDAFITKYTSSGTYLWTKILGGTPGSNAVGYGIAVDSTNNIYLSGEFSGTVAFDGLGGTDSHTSINSTFFIIKYDTSANYVYVRTSFNGVGGGAFGANNQLSVDKYNNVYIVGYFSGEVTFDGAGGSDTRTIPNTNSSTYLTKFDSLGNYGWTKNFNADNGNAIASGIVVDHLGNIYITGGFDGTVIFGANGSDSHTAPPGNSNFFLTSYQILPYPSSSLPPGAPDTGFGGKIGSPLKTLFSYSLTAGGVLAVATIINLLARRRRWL